MLFHSVREFFFNLTVLERSYLLTNLRLHPCIFGISPIDHVMLALFTFPGAAQHIAAHSALEVAQVAETIVPAHGLHGGAAICGSTGHYFRQLVDKQMFKVGAVHISVQQLIIAYFALGQSFPSQHAAAHTSHVFAIPVLL
jgi:hypothetical protein